MPPGSVLLTGPAEVIGDYAGEFFAGTYTPGAVDVRVARWQIELYKHTTGHVAEVLAWSVDRDASATERSLAAFSVEVPELLTSGTAYCWRARARGKDDSWTPWTDKQLLSLLAAQPTIGTLQPGGLSFSTLNGVRFSAAFNGPGTPVRVRIQARPNGASDWNPETLVWDSGDSTVPVSDQARPGKFYGGKGLGPGTFNWRIQVTNHLGGVSAWSTANFTLTVGWQPNPGAVALMTGYDRRAHTKARILIRAVNTGTEAVPGDRGPLNPPIAIIENASNIGAGEWRNTPGEIFWTMAVDDPQVGVIEPYLVHYALELYRGEGWKEVHAGLVVDFSATADEVVFYGMDYLGLLSKVYDERFSSKGPDTPISKGGAKYVKKPISYIVQNQLENAKATLHSPVGFINVPTLADWQEKITIISTFKERLSFILGLLESHAAGTGRRTRIKYTKSISGVYSWDVQSSPGTNRDNLRMEYGGLVQAFEVVPFEDFGTKVMGVGRTVTGTMPMYAEAHPVETSADNKPFPEWHWGSFPKIGLWQDLIDKNDLKRRAARLARMTGKVGKRVAIALRVDALDVKDGWDIADAIPIDIDRGVVNTGNYGSGYWVIAGWQWRLYPDGHTDLVLSFEPRDDNIAVDLTIIDSDPVLISEPWASDCGHPATLAVPDGVKFYYDHCSGLSYRRDDCDEPDIGWAACASLAPVSPTVVNILEYWGPSSTAYSPPATGPAGYSVYPDYVNPVFALSAFRGHRVTTAQYQERVTIATYELPPGTTHVRLDARFLFGGNFFAGGTLPIQHQWALSATDWNQLSGDATVVGSWVPNGGPLSGGGTIAETMHGSYASYQNQVGVPINLIIPASQGKFQLHLRNLSLTGARLGPSESTFTGDDTGQPATYNSVALVPLAYNSASLNASMALQPIGCPPMFSLGDALTGLVIDPSSSDTSASSSVVGGTLTSVWGAGVSWLKKTVNANMAIGSNDERFIGGMHLAIDCASAGGLEVFAADPGTSQYVTWELNVTMRDGTSHKAAWSLFRGGYLYEDGRLYDGSAGTYTWTPEVYHANLSLDSEPIMAQLSSPASQRLSLTMDDLGVFRASLGAVEIVSTKLPVTDPQAGVQSISVKVSKRTLVPATVSATLQVLPYAPPTFDCWKQVIPTVFDNPTAEVLYPQAGQYVTERKIADGDGVNAYFYLSLDGTQPPAFASPYAPGSVRLKVDGLYQDVGEADPATGLILLDFIPNVGEQVFAEWRAKAVDVAVP